MPEINVEGINVEIEVFCSCGEGLCNQSSGGSSKRGTPTVTVEPCEKCLGQARDEGYDEGHDAALKVVGE